MLPTIPAADIRHGVPLPSGDRRSAPWRMIGVGAGVLSEGVAGYLHPVLGEALAAVDIIVPMVVSLILLIAILCGSSRTCERAFRLLRWITNRPEPPAPERRQSRTSRQHQDRIRPR
jgi:hypothetical protein